MTPEISAALLAFADVCLAEGRDDGTNTGIALATADTAVLGPALPCALDTEIRALLFQSTHPAAAAALAAQDHIPWGTNPVAASMNADALAICAVATLMGPEGPLVCPDFRYGLFYQRPNTYYALHSHDALETYTIIAGRALWTAGDDTSEREAGCSIHHTSLMPHAFRTGPEGFVALWRWSGDINLTSYLMLDDPLIAAA